MRCGIREERRKHMAGAALAYANGFSALGKAGKIGIISSTNRFSNIGPQVPWESDCPQPIEDTFDAFGRLVRRSRGTTSFGCGSWVTFASRS